MGIFKTLTKLSKYKTNRTFLTSTTIISSTPFPSSPLSLSFSRPRLVPSFSCPLFLSSPPWKLSQSATPVHLQSDAVLLEKAKSFNLLRTRNLPIRLGILPTVSTNPTLLLNTVDVKDFRNDVEDGSEGFRESFVNLPNLVSMSRLVSGPILGLMIIQGWYFPAFVGLAVSGATDWLDGYIARKMNIISVVGSYLDPLADKVLIGCVALAMVHDNLLHPGLVGLVVLRDVFLVSGAVYKRASILNWKWKSWYDFLDLNGTSPQKVEPLFISKVNTVLQLALVAGALLQQDFGTEGSQSYLTYLSWLVASTTVASTAAYGIQQMSIRSASSIRNY